MLDSPRPYKISFDADAKYPTYQFATDSGVKYTAYFINCANFSPALADTYSFNVAPDRDVSKLPLDVRIAHTLVQILQLFFRTQHQSAIYICDNKDDKAERRFNVFNYWFNLANDETISKTDIKLILKEYSIFSSLLVRKDNPQISNIIQAFEEYFS